MEDNYYLLGIVVQSYNRCKGKRKERWRISWLGLNRPDKHRYKKKYFKF